ncbi:hypothetical protein FRC12_005226 [Ceratobasidium sp. 428]|nr:hypothetical protein FRC12_005226 [Ceratobasidium sp. 428]
MSTSTAHSRVFETPDLLRAICSVSKHRTCTALLRLNKSSFRVAAPFVWNKVTQVTYLLRLIPGVNIPATSQGVIKITLPPFASADFSRFTMYAPYIRSLDVHSNVSVSPWRTLVLQSKQQPLLPRLSSLTVWQENRKDPITKELVWMSILLTQSVASICVQRSHKAAMGSRQGIFTLLDMVANTCPHVQDLKLPAITGGTEETDGEHYLLNLFSGRTASDSFQIFSSLRTLTTGLSLLCSESFQALGSLPHLRHLHIYTGNSGTAGVLEAVPSDENLFPALEYLCLENLYWKDIVLVLGQQSLVKKPASLRLVLDDTTTRITLDNISDIFAMLQGMGCLIDLDVDLSRSVGCYKIEPGGMILSVLSKLPLRVVQLDNAEFLTISEVHLYQVFPSLTELRMSHQLVGMHEFHVFAAMPKLQYLAVLLGDSTT